MPRKFIFVLLLVWLLAFAGCKQDKQVEAFIKDLDQLTNEVVQKVQSSPDAAGLEAAQKLVDSKKAEMITRLDALKESQDEEAKKKLNASRIASGQKIANLSEVITPAAVKNPPLATKFGALLKSYTDMLQ